jgi:DNA-binding NarL/FixJ family response regulator
MPEPSSFERLRPPSDPLPRAAIGREREIAALDEFLAARASVQALVLAGEPGIGKTTLWEAGIAAARERGVRVLSTRANGAEAQLSRAGLIDLLDGVDGSELDGLPAPQRRALEVALLRAEPSGAPPEPQAVALGFLNALRALAARDPLLVAVDDVQWLDQPSAGALAFAARRLDGDSVGFLLARRARRPSHLEAALEPARLLRVDVGPLSLGALRRLLLERLALSVPRHLLRRLAESTLGNPLFALELGRTLTERQLPAIGEEIPLPDAVEELLGPRVAGLAPPVQTLLLAVALSADPRASELAALPDGAALGDAVDAGVLVVDGDRVRASHPLLAAAARKRSRSSARLELHLELAGVVSDDELRARHLALATERPDAGLADAIAAAAARAAARGGVEDAVELAGHALRLTPPDQEQRTERILVLAELLLVAGEEERVRDLIAPELASLPPGAARVRAHLLLADSSAVTDAGGHERELEEAFEQSAGDPLLRATVLARMAEEWAAGRVERIGDAEASAVEALAAAHRGGPESERLVLYPLAWTRILRGRDIEDLRERFDRVSGASAQLYRSIDRLAAIRRAWRGEARAAREAFTQLLALADERGELWSSVVLRLQLCELELRAGGWAAASRLLDEWSESPERELLIHPAYERCRALLAAGLGLPVEAERWSAQAIAGAEVAGMRWDELEGLRARGIAALIAHEPDAAVKALRAVWEHVEREGVEDPGAFPVAPDLVEALLGLGEVDEALRVTDRLNELAERLEHPWARVTAKRCGAVVRLASQAYDEEAAAAVAQAAAAYEELGLRFDRARSLLLLGRAARRSRKWAAARASLEETAAAFDGLGSPGWAEEARSELARVGGRRPRGSDQLTPTEQRVVDLAVEGLSNKEIAQTLFVTVGTVEAHLSHAYAKLGVRSRAQLARARSAQA